MFDTRVFYSPNLFFSNIALYTSEIEMYFLIFRGVDMIFPFAYALLIIQLLRKLGSKHTLIPIAALVFDLSENIVLSILIYLKDSSLDFLVYIVNSITMFKFTAILVSIIMITILAVKKGRARYGF